MVRAHELVNRKTNGSRGQLIFIVAYKIIYTLETNDAREILQYQQEGDNCNVVYGNEISKFQNSNFVSVFCEDFYKILLEQIITMYDLSIAPMGDFACPDSISSQILDTVKTSLSLRSVKLDIERLQLEIFGFEQVMDILSFVNPKQLYSLILRFPASGAEEDFEQLLALERWSEFENLELEVHWHTVSAKEIMCIKKTLTTSRIFGSIKIWYEEIDEEKVKEMLGHSRRELDHYVERYIRVPISTIQVLRTTIECYCHSLRVDRVSDKDIYDSLPASDEDLIPFEVNSDWSKTLENKTIIELLLDHLGFIEIQTLRKVCSNIRTCIDHFKPNPNLKILRIWITSGYVSIKMGFKNGSCLETGYGQVESGCKVGKALVKKDVYQTCLDDLKSILPRKQMNLEEFEFAFHSFRNLFNGEFFKGAIEFIERVKEVLTPNNVLMKVRRFIHLENCVQHNVILEPIKWLEPISLECIQTYMEKDIWHTADGSEANIKMSEVVKLKMDTNQWQYAKEYVNKEFALLGEVNPIHFVHFSKIDITVKNWSNEDFFNWQEEILYSPSFLRYKISFRDCSIDNDIYNLLGLPFRTVNGRTTWYFKMPEKNQVLHVLYYTSQSIVFTRVDIEDVPEVVVMNFDVQLVD
ncbi:hypothetical protein CRE_19866 [Caenorhabditis remanei]|uniref:F-box domain-containing protein n=1 Tax=Caenorhabditis remanei TaxID=31234 RepID=E3MTD3_CAERE|nr:hypothetical protein CRE_19866 [Caenorhabditis remanei]